jgi:hypothetical protein
MCDCGLDEAKFIIGSYNNEERKSLSFKDAVSCYDYTVPMLTPRSRKFPKKLKGPQLVRKFRVFYGRFITTITRARHLFLSQDRQSQSLTLFHFSKINFNIILP